MIIVSFSYYSSYTYFTLYECYICVLSVYLYFTIFCVNFLCLWSKTVHVYTCTLTVNYVTQLGYTMSTCIACTRMAIYICYLRPINNLNRRRASINLASPRWVLVASRETSSVILSALIGTVASTRFAWIQRLGRHAILHRPQLRVFNQSIFICIRHCP